MSSIVRKAITNVFQSLFSKNSTSQDFTFSLSPQQERGILEFISGNNTFVSLPTGHGKSLIYQLAIPVVKKLSHDNNFKDKHFPNSPLLLVVSPLQALVSDQIKSCEGLGLYCAKLEDVENVITTDLVFTSPEPEMLFWRE